MLFDRFDNDFTDPQIQYTMQDQDFEIRLEGEVKLFYINGYGRAFQTGNRTSGQVVDAIRPGYIARLSR